MNASVDEAGRGCLFGRVYAAAVIWDNSIIHDELKDSKKLNVIQRKRMREFILENCIDYGIGYAEPWEIDKLNILQATMLAMHRALDGLHLMVDIIEVDGNYFKQWNNTQYKCYVKGDVLFPSISAASILAKTTRDDYMDSMHFKYPKYCFDKNKGYGTVKHYEMLKMYGKTPLHRNFNLHVR